METTKDKRIQWPVVLLLSTAAAVPLCARARGQIVVLANTSVKATEVSRADLRDAFTGISGALRDGSRVSPVLLKEGTVHDAFLNQYIGRSDAAFRANWRSLLFSGQGSMPRTLDSESEVIEYVAHTPGAIGYVTKSAPHEGVKVLAVK